MEQKVHFDQFGWRIVTEDVQLPDGRTKSTPFIDRNDTVHILAFPDPTHVLLLKEFRASLNRYAHLIPSGKVNTGETDLAAAAGRELREETGYEADIIEPYFSTRMYGSSRQTFHYFLAKGLKHNPLPRDDDEFIEVLTLPLREALARIFAEDPVHIHSGFALSRYLLEHS